MIKWLEGLEEHELDSGLPHAGINSMPACCVEGDAINCLTYRAALITVALGATVVTTGGAQRQLVQKFDGEARQRVGDDRSLAPERRRPRGAVRREHDPAAGLVPLFGRPRVAHNVRDGCSPSNPLELSCGAARAGC